MNKFLLKLLTIVIIIVIAFSLHNTVNAEIGVIDSYSESNYDSSIPIGVGTGNVLVGQSFTNNYDVTVSSVKLYLKKSNLPTGTTYVRIYSHLGTYGVDSVPNSSALLGITTSRVNVASLTNAFQLVTFNFTTPRTLYGGTKYVLELFYAGGDSSNYVLVGSDSISPAALGNVSTSNNGSTWTAVQSQDLIFYVNGSYSGAAPAAPLADAGPWVFDTPGTTSWTPPAGVNKVKVQVWGAGGGASGGGYWYDGYYQAYLAYIKLYFHKGCGGGSGGYGEKIISYPSASGYNVTVGTGGSGGIATELDFISPSIRAGQNGSASSFGSLITSTGGSGASPTEGGSLTYNSLFVENSPPIIDCVPGIGGTSNGSINIDGTVGSNGASSKDAGYTCNGTNGVSPAGGGEGGGFDDIALDSVGECTGGDGGSGKVVITYIPPAANPTVTIMANPNPVAYGASTNISWISSNTSSCVIKKDGSSWQNGTSGSNYSSDPIYAQTEFTADCIGTDPNTSATASLTIELLSSGHAGVAFSKFISFLLNITDVATVVTPTVVPTVADPNIVSGADTSQVKLWFQNNKPTSNYWPALNLTKRITVGRNVTVEFYFKEEELDNCQGIVTFPSSGWSPNGWVNGNISNPGTFTFQNLSKGIYKTKLLCLTSTRKEVYSNEIKIEVTEPTIKED